MNTLEELASAIVYALVSDKEHVEISATDLSRSINIMIRVSNSDMGKILGRERSTFNAFRNLMEFAGRRRGKIARIELLDPYAHIERRSSEPFAFAEDWDRETFEKVLSGLCRFVFSEEVAISRQKVMATITIYEIRLGRGEITERLNECQEDFETLFCAIGKSLRHSVHVDLIPASKKEKKENASRA
jgi:predicted RNA-binding protein YlqC (UPF0109 family)